ncbi:RHS repeat-associated core domain-containing protein [Micromonospora sp. NPDC005172]|uniref:RHS repeat-associated core domain-containing protein n=1 Tax=Micromonospora sp. NPDC005172 TaxID=3156867 RepID=UPI0033B5BE2E
MVGNTIGAGSAYWTSWQIDLIGNRTQQTEHNLTGGADTKTVYAYNGNGQNKPHTLTSTTTTGGTAGTTSYSYDNAGNTTGRNAAQGSQTLTWDDAGKLADVTGGTSGNNSFIYDADGNLLLQKEPGKNTLYLPGQQLTLNTATSVVTGSRYYALPGGGSCIRTGSGTAYTFAIADHQGTPSLYLDNTAQNPTWRQYTPYGGARGAAVAAPDNRGFLNKPMSPVGLTTIGARSYDPAIGRFTSVDPLQAAGQPQQWNGYSYSNNTPVTSSDPTGLIPEGCRHFDCYGYDPRPLKKGDGRGAGGCPGGCGTAKNKAWGKANHKSTTKAKIVDKHVAPRRETPKPGPGPKPDVSQLLAGTPDPGPIGCWAAKPTDCAAEEPLVANVKMEGVCLTGSFAGILGGGVTGCVAFDRQGVGWTYTKGIDIGPNFGVFGGVGSVASDGSIDDQAGTSQYWQAGAGAEASGSVSFTAGTGKHGQPVHSVGASAGVGVGGGYTEGGSKTAAGRWFDWSDVTGLLG